MDLLQATGLTEARVMASILVLARIGPLFALAPVFGSRLIPGRARALCAVALAFALAPVVAGSTRVPTEVTSLVLTLAGEVLVGVAFAFSVSMLFQAITTAGSLLDSLIGFSYGSLVDPVNGTQATVLQNAYTLMAAVVFLTIGGDHWVLEGWVRTFDLLPAGQPPDLADLSEGVRLVFTGIFLSALQVAAPVLVALLLTDVALGVLTRAAPQMNIMSVAFPFKIGIGIVVLLASLPFVGGWVADQVQVAVRDALRVVAGA